MSTTETIFSSLGTITVLYIRKTTNTGDVVVVEKVDCKDVKAANLQMLELG